MQNKLTFEIEFRFNRLSVRLERLAANFDRLATLILAGEHSGQALQCLQECKLFIEWTGIDLDVDRAYELVQMQRQLVQWQRNWESIWTVAEERSAIGQDLQTWRVQVQEMTLVLA
jgi:hypothetical protein